MCLHRRLAGCYGVSACSVDIGAQGLPPGCGRPAPRCPAPPSLTPGRTDQSNGHRPLPYVGCNGGPARLRPSDRRAGAWLVLETAPMALFAGLRSPRHTPHSEVPFSADSSRLMLGVQVLGKEGKGRTQPAEAHRRRLATRRSLPRSDTPMRLGPSPLTATLAGTRTAVQGAWDPLVMSALDSCDSTEGRPEVCRSFRTSGAPV